MPKGSATVGAAQGVVLGDLGRAAGQRRSGASAREREGADDEPGRPRRCREGRPDARRNAPRHHRRRTRGSMTP